MNIKDAVWGTRQNIKILQSIIKKNKVNDAIKTKEIYVKSELICLSKPSTALF